MQILTDEDFKKIKFKEMANELQPKAGKKRKRATDKSPTKDRFVFRQLEGQVVFLYHAMRAHDDFGIL